MWLLRELVALVAPPACAACGAPLEVAGALVCSPCLRALRWLGAAGCRRCGLPWHPSGRACPALRAAFATAWAPVAYHGAGQDLVRALKFRAALPLASLMAAQITANAPTWALGGHPPAAPTPPPGEPTPPAPPMAIVPVPAAPARRRQRGFDPAELLACAVAERLGLPLQACLRRPRRASRQLGASRAERRAHGRVEVAAVAQPPPVVLLVDDVHTTGATLDACATVLREAGAARVHAITYARAV